MNRRLATIGGTLLAALSIHGAPASSSPPARTAATISRAAAAADELRRTLEEAYQLILSRDLPKPPAFSSELDDFDVIPGPQIDIPDHAAVDRAVQHLANDIPAKIQDSLDRSTPYRVMINRVFAEYGLPRELAYLPIIESAYKTFATSRAGARGMWQFTTDTAHDYGLRVDWWVDERADPERSTRAAAQYLRDLWDTFGDWSLVLAAYNAGPGRVRRTLDHRRASDFWHLLEMGALPRETRGYVPTFWATMKIVSDPESFGFRVSTPQSNDTEIVDVEGPVSLAWIATVADIDVAGLENLNPAIRHGLTPPGPYPVRVPARGAKALNATAATLQGEDPWLFAARYVVRRGDSVSSLARRIGLRSTSIREMNGLRSDRLRTGETIWLPTSQAELSRLLRDTKGTIHIVRNGDTLFGIALRYGVSLDELLDLNGLTKKSVLHPGDRIRLSSAAAVPASGM